MNKSAQADGVPTARGAGEKDPFLVALGERVRTLRARRGLTRKALALDAGVSERHVANLESGVGNASVLFLRQLAQAFGGVQAVGGGAGAFESDATLSDVVPGRESCVEQFDGDGVAVGCEVGGGC